MSIISRILVNGIVGIVTAGLMAVLALTIYQVGPSVEKTFFPVLTDFKIETVKRLGDKIAFQFSYTKHRDCRLLSLSWFRSEDVVVGPSDVSLVTKGPIAVRPSGHNLSNWWQLNDAIPEGMYQLVFIYDCGLPWVTKTISKSVEIKLP